MPTEGRSPGLAVLAIGFSFRGAEYPPRLLLCDLSR
jgi:hypothetical protein